MSGVPRLVSAYDGLLVDLDGVVYVGADAVPGAVEALTRAHDDGVGWAFVTNNASRPAADVAEHLTRLGLAADADAVVTSAQVAASLVRERFDSGSAVLAVGGPGVAIALEEVGLRPVTSAEDDPVAVVQGFGREVGWAQLAEATYAVRAGALFVATNTDAVIPTERGAAPGNGTLVGAVRTATDVEPVVAGKPEPVAFTDAATRIGSHRPLVVGDRLDTDIGGGNAAGFDTLLVLTGVHGPRHLLACPAQQRPVHVVGDLSALHAPVPPVEVDGDRATCAHVVVRLVDGELRLAEGGDDLDGPDPVAALRAALALAWPATDDGTEVAVSSELAALWRTLPQ